MKALDYQNKNKHIIRAISKFINLKIKRILNN